MLSHQVAQEDKESAAVCTEWHEVMYLVADTMPLVLPITCRNLDKRGFSASVKKCMPAVLDANRTYACQLAS